MPDRSLLVLDSASLYYRSFYALPDSMTAPDGRPHNAIRGLLSTITRLFEDHSPAAVVACWDNDWRPQWRVDLVAGYKAHRVADADSGAETEPEHLSAQAEAIAEILEACGVLVLGFDGFEADDVIGSLAAQHPLPCIVVSGDRDLVQVVDDRTRLRLTVNGGMDKWPLLDPAEVVDRFGVEPQRYVDLAVLRGDPSDGLPGVAGVGAKTAVSLVQAFGDLDGVLESARTTPGQRPMTPRLAATIRAAEAAILAARTVATVRTDLPVLVDAPARDRDRLDALAAQWGVQRQVADLLASLDRQTAEE